MTLLDHGYINLVEAWGSDENIIRAARMSTDKGFQGWGPRERCNRCGFKQGDPGERPCSNDSSHDFQGDEKLLRYLYTHKHMTPFEMAGAVIEVQAPIMVFREWHRHRTQSYNELSARYTELPDLFYVPSLARLTHGGQGVGNKQSSGNRLEADVAQRAQEQIRAAGTDARQRYRALLDSGVARELARLVIPVNQYSRMRASANLRNWLGFLELRQAAGAQWEIRQYANALHAILYKEFPRTLALFDEGQS